MRVRQHKGYRLTELENEIERLGVEIKINKFTNIFFFLVGNEGII